MASDMKITLSAQEFESLAEVKAGDTIRIEATVESNDGTSVVAMAEGAEPSGEDTAEEEGTEKSDEGEMAMEAMGMGKKSKE
jgi:hypothetical protein